MTPRGERACVGAASVMDDQRSRVAFASFSNENAFAMSGKRDAFYTISMREGCAHPSTKVRASKHEGSRK